MRIIRYGFFGEDDAQRLFLHHYLTILAAGRAWRFEADTVFQPAGRTKQQVRARFEEVCETAFLRHGHECFFVGLDVDSHLAAAVAQTERDLQEKLDARRLTAAVLMLPVQCIEHWLRYLQWRNENPGSNKNITLETEERRTAKINLYASPKPANRHSNPIVEQVARTLDIAWLESRSESFRAFHGRVTRYLQSQGLRPS